MAKANQPAAKFRLGYVTATVWLNDKFYNVVLSKCLWRTQSGERHGGAGRAYALPTAGRVEGV